MYHYIRKFFYCVYNSSNPIRLNLIDNKWHHLGVVRRSRWEIYIDGRNVRNIYRDQPSEMQGGGTLLIGGDLDSWDGYINPAATSQTFQGEISHVNVWDMNMNNQQMEDLATMCGEETGNLVAWPDLKHHVYGNVQVINSSGCIGEQSKYLIYLKLTLKF